MRTLGYALAAILGAAFTIFAANLGIVVLPEKLTPKSVALELDLSYTDFLTVMFAGTTLVLTALAIFVGLVAFFTYQGIKDEAVRSIEKAVEEKAPQLHEKIEQRSDELFKSKSEQLDEQIKQHIQGALERAGRDGKLDDALQRALVSMGMGLSTLDREASQDSDERKVT